jgi:hypothetical protein
MRQVLRLGLTQGLVQPQKRLFKAGPMDRESQVPSRSFNLQNTVGVRPGRVVEHNENQPRGGARRQTVGDGVGRLQEAVGLQKNRAPVSEQGCPVCHADGDLLVVREGGGGILDVLPRGVCLRGPVTRHRCRQSNVTPAKGVGDRFGKWHGASRVEAVGSEAAFRRDGSCGS